MNGSEERPTPDRDPVEVRQYVVTVEADGGQRECDRVIEERMNFDEDYGFAYSLTWQRVES